jgi:histidinol-phosphate phosphatase family protein
VEKDRVTRQGEPLVPAVFFDRDGIVNESPGPGYVERVEDFRIVPAFLDVLRIALHRGYRAVIVTNQRGVGLGRMSMDTLEAIHQRLRTEVQRAGLELTDIYVCTATADDHPDRKPNPGMLLKAAHDHHLALHVSWMIGDSEKDVEAGRRAGCGVTVRVAPLGTVTDADFLVPDMESLVALLESKLPRWPPTPSRSETN